ncbi:Class II abasic (AP) endonuclease [Diplodia intermedia]|uniref:Class II abasic (AP) endonuclease n=1 Tax=Diplodia intermedia TaxID=856260 RepID=A0ABR3T1U9_9PEZI
MTSRRQDLLSEASTVGTTTSSLRADVADNLLLLDLLNSENAESDFENAFTLEQQLGRLLSTRSMISTSSSFAEQQHTAVDGQATYRLIGWGACGVIYAQDGSSLVLKLAKTDDQQLWTDYLMNTRAWEALARIPEVSEEIHIPQPSFYVPKSEQGWWKRNQDMFPTADSPVHLPTAVLCSERILPLPSEIRNKLIEKFCAPRNRSKALQSPGNKDCLVRTYLGSRQGKTGGLFFSLRNFKLHLNQMLELEMPTFPLAEYMAGALATMHWEARIDARDVEFVLGSAPTYPLIKPLTTAELRETEPDTYTEMKVCRKANFRQRTVHLWMLDFNQCRTISMDEFGVHLAVEAYIINDPYYPRPPKNDGNDQDLALWNVFATRYLRISDRILRETPELRALPRKFIHGVIKVCEEKLKKQEEAAAASA